MTREGALDYAGLEEAVGRAGGGAEGEGAGAGRPGRELAAQEPDDRLLPLACARAGLVHVPINPLLKRMQVAHILADSGAELLISGQARLATLETGDLPAACAILDEAGGAALFEHADALAPSAAAIPTISPPCSTRRARPAGPRA